VAGLVLAVSIVSVINADDGRALSDHEERYLIDGTMTPFSDPETRTHVFSVLVIDDNITKVVVEIYDGGKKAYYDLDYVGAEDGGRRFEGTVTLESDSVNYHSFIGVAPDTNHSTPYAYGPQDKSSGDLWYQAILQAEVQTMVYSGLLFLMLVFIGVMGDRTKKRVEEIKAQQKATLEKGKFICSECRAEVPANARTCPQCGEIFDDEEPPKDAPQEQKEGEYECTECGATVKESDAVCWKCGKEFDED